MSSKLQVDSDARLIHLGSEISYDVVPEFAAALIAMKPSRRPLTLMFHSPGGCVASSLAMFDLIRSYPTKVNGLVFGDCLSAAVLVLQACDRRLMSVNSRLMMHDGMSSAIRVPARDVVPEAKEDKRLGDRFNFLLAQCSGNTVQKIERWSAECTYLTAQQAVEKGFADEIVGSRNRTPVKGIKRRRR